MQESPVHKCSIKRTNKVKFNKIKHAKTETRASKDCSQSEQRKLCDPDPRFLTCEEEVTPVWLPHTARDARCALSTWQSLRLPRLSSQPQPTVSVEGGNDVKGGADGARGLCCRDMQETPAPLQVSALAEAFGRQDWPCRTASEPQLPAARPPGYAASRSLTTITSIPMEHHSGPGAHTTTPSSPAESIHCAFLS